MNNFDIAAPLLEDSSAQGHGSGNVLSLLALFREG